MTQTGWGGSAPGMAGQDTATGTARPEIATPGGEQGGMEQAKEKLSQATEQVGEKAQQVTGEARQRLRQQIDTRSTTAGDQMTAAGSAVRDASQQLRGQGHDLPAQLMEQAAGRMEKLGGYLRGSSADGILRDIEDMGRRQPWAVIGGGIALGFLGARFLKSSSRSRYQGMQFQTRPGMRAPAAGVSWGDPMLDPTAPPVTTPEMDLYGTPAETLPRQPVSPPMPEDDPLTGGAA